MPAILDSELEEEEEGTTTPPPEDEEDSFLETPGVSDCLDPAALEADWAPHYHSCPRWQNIWVATQTPGSEWPNGVRLHAGKMFTQEHLCIPMSLQKLWVKQAHAQMGHAVSERLWALLEIQDA